MRRVGYVVLVAVACLLPVDAFAASKYALVIGIKDYPGVSQKLYFADRDAEAFAAFLKSNVGGAFPPDNVRLLTNGRATRTAIMRQLRWLHDVVRPDDQVVVFFAGHGIAEPDRRVYFLPTDAAEDLVEDRGIRADELWGAVRTTISPRRLLLFIDACHAAAAIRPGGTTRSGATTLVEGLKDQLDALEPLQLALFASRSGELAGEDPALGHGIFTYYLLKGLQEGHADGAGNGESDGRVTADELYRYLLDQVPAAAKDRLKIEQHPTIHVPDNGDSVLAVLSAPVPSLPRSQTISEALDAFKRAYEARQLAIMAKVFPARSLEDTERLFASVTEITVQPGEPQVTEEGTTASVLYPLYLIQFQPVEGRRDKRTYRAEFTLSGDDLGWRIVRVRFDRVS